MSEPHRRSQSAARGTGAGERARPRVPPLEWAMGALGALVVIGAVGAFVAEGVRGNGRPPALSASVQAVTPTADGYRAELRVINRGGPAADVLVEAELTDAEGSARSEVTFDYLPEGATRRAGVFLPRAPAPGTLRVRVHGYRDP